jgi:hypothetical protein
MGKLRWLLVFLPICGFGQSLWLEVQFVDKPILSAEYRDAAAFLSPRAIARRERLGIPVTPEDFPVNKSYIHTIEALAQTQIRYALKWSNSVVILVHQDALQNIHSLPFVAKTRIIGKLNPSRGSNIPDKFEQELLKANYGDAWPQVGMLGVNRLHLMGYTGSGISIAVFDAGFLGLDTMRFFKPLIDEGRLKGMWDFVDGQLPITDIGFHGTAVTSTMCGNQNGKLVGTAPQADFYLYRTEDVGDERLIEEYNWARAAEHADSLGIDIINSSLGYTTFTDSTENHTYADMDGNTTPVTRAANKAASKGILVVASAGNSGTNPWFYISAPADGRDVLAVGAVNAGMETAPFSSRGPNAAGDIKPNVCGLGWGASFVSLDGAIIKGNGTSFSGPIIAGACAALWQAFPDFDNFTIKRAVMQSAHQYQAPDAECGYGIPDFSTAYALLDTLSRKLTAHPEQLGSFSLYPNPTQGAFSISFLSDYIMSVKLRIHDFAGREITRWEGNSKSGLNHIHQHIPRMEKGVYSLTLDKGFEINTRMLIVY